MNRLLSRWHGVVIAHLIIFAILSPPSARADKPELIVQTGHSGIYGWITCVAYSPDGKTLASCSHDKTVKLWDITTGMQLNSLTGHEHAVFSVAFSPDGKKIASASDDCTVRIWDVATGAELHKLQHPTMVCSTEFSGDGKLVASQAWDKTVRIWDAESGRLMLDPLGQPDLTDSSGNRHLGKVTFSIDGKILANACNENIVILRDSHTGKQLRTLTGHTKTVRFVAFSPDNKSVATAGDDCTIRIWDIETGVQKKSFAGHTESIWSVAFSPDGKTLVSGSHDKTVKLWDLVSGKEVRTFAGHADMVETVAFSPDGKGIASGGEDKIIKLWDVATSDSRELSGYCSAVNSLAFSSNGKLLASALADGHVQLWDTSTGIGQKSLEGHLGSVNAIAVSPDGKVLASSGLDKTIRLWKIGSSDPEKLLRGHKGWVGALAFSPDGKTLASGSADCNIKIWDTDVGNEIRSIEGHTGVVDALAFTPDGKTLVSASWDKTIRQWQTSDWTSTLTMKGHSQAVTGVAISPDGKTLCSASRDYTVKMWDMNTGVDLRSLVGHRNWVLSVAFSADGKTVASASYDNTVKLWDAATAAEQRTLNGHSDAVDAVAISPDCKIVASGSWDTTVKLWQMDTGTELGTLCNLKNKDWAVVTSDGRFDASTDGMELMHWRLGTHALRLNQLKRAFYEPGLLAKLTGHNKQPLRKVAPLQDVKLFPDLSYEPINANDPRLVLKLKNRGGGIGQIEVRVNGKELAEDACPRGLDRDAETATISVDLSGATTISGAQNKVTVITHNRAGDLSSRDVSINFTKNSQITSTRDVNVYAIVGGVSRYADPNLDLKYSGKDASDIAKGIELGAKKLFGADRVHVTLLSSLEKRPEALPTKENFQKAFLNATSARPQDILIVYLAGHGTTLAKGEDKYYYLTADSKGSDLSNFKLIEKSGISSEQLAEWVKKIRALKQVLILDTCAAGAASTKLTERRDIPGDQIRAIDRLKDRVGFYVLMGCAADAVSYETNRYGQGVLTYALLQGLKGAALRNDEFADVAKLFQYASDEVPQLAQNIGGIQHPIIAAPHGSSFDFGELTATEKSAIPLAKLSPIVLRPRLLRSDDFTDAPLELSNALMKRLNADSLIVSTDHSPLIHFVDSEEFPDGIRPTGSYTVNGDDVIIEHLVLTRENQKKSLKTIKGSFSGKDKLVQDIALAIEEAASKW